MTRLLNKRKEYTIYINNLFISLKLLSILRDYGIRATDTVRTSKIKREKNEKNREK